MWKERNKCIFQVTQRPRQIVLQEVVNQVKSRANFLYLKVSDNLASAWDKNSVGLSKKIRHAIKEDWNMFISSQRGSSVRVIRSKNGDWVWSGSANHEDMYEAASILLIER